jgi:hypothetical protein
MNQDQRAAFNAVLADLIRANRRLDFYEVAARMRQHYGVQVSARDAAAEWQQQMELARRQGEQHVLNPESNT